MALVSLETVVQTVLTARKIRESRSALSTVQGTGLTHAAGSKLTAYAVPIEVALFSAVAAGMSY
jgi:hypothetical protein